MANPTQTLIAWAAAVCCTPVFAQSPNNQTATDGTLPTVVVTGSRAPTLLKNEPQRIEVVGRADIDNTPQRELVDVLKKNTSVDLIQYPGALAGIGVRGFGPQFSGINQRTLVLVDGLPAMTDNLSTLGTQDVRQIELLKGPASALYGSQAMGGVLNLVTRRSTGPLHGAVTVEAGNFDARALQGRVGGSVGETLNFDYAGNVQHQGNFKMGNGQTREHSKYTVQNHSLRLGIDLGNTWKLDWRGDLYRGKDIQNPGDVAYGITNQTTKDLDRWGQRVTLQGNLNSAHTVNASVFQGKQTAKNSTVSSLWDPVGTVYPYRSFDGRMIGKACS